MENTVYEYFIPQLRIVRFFQPWSLKQYPVVAIYLSGVYLKVRLDDIWFVN